MRLLLRDCRVNRLRGCCSIRGRSLQGAGKRDRLKERQGTEREGEESKKCKRKESGTEERMDDEVGEGRNRLKETENNEEDRNKRQ